MLMFVAIVVEKEQHSGSATVVCDQMPSYHLGTFWQFVT